MASSIQPGILRQFTAGTYLARVQLTGSVHMALDGVPTNRGIASGDMVAGRNVAVLIFDETLTTDAVVLAVYT